MEIKQAIHAAKEILERLDKKQTVNSQQFGIVFQTITRLPYQFTNCLTCWIRDIATLRHHLSLREGEGCTDCPKPEEIVIDNENQQISNDAPAEGTGDNTDLNIIISSNNVIINTFDLETRLASIAEQIIEPYTVVVEEKIITSTATTSHKHKKKK